MLELFLNTIVVTLGVGTGLVILLVVLALLGAIVKVRVKKTKK